MKEVKKKKITSLEINNQTDNVVVQTDIDSKDGQNKCPKCGSSDISPKLDGHLICNFCRFEFEPVKVSGMVQDISKLDGDVIASGASDIVPDAEDVVTLKCESCGAEVVIDTSSALQARCHWCRNTLSINKQMPNGAVPDVVLPFKIEKDVARNEIEKFVNKRKFFAHPIFKKEFTTENIMGVYFPYMLVDINAHASFSGEGEHQTRRYTVKNGDTYTTYYDADLYDVKREFDITINELSIESNSDRLDSSSKDKTNNIINSIMPFDTENSVKYDANYLKGYTSERRDTNIDGLKTIADLQAEDIARFAANDTLMEYDRGVAWSKQDFKIKGHQWKAAYLPVWLYSYQEVKGNKKLLHYVAVNARTKETMGSVPIHMPKLIMTSIIVEILGILSMLWIDFDENWIFLLTGVVFYIIMYNKYRNKGARHTYEKETKREISNLRSEDNFIRHRKGLSNSTMTGANNKILKGSHMSNDMLKAIKESNIVNDLVDANNITNAIKKGINKKD